MASGKVLLVANTDWYLYNFRLEFAQFLRAQGLEVVMVSPAGNFSAEFEPMGFRFIAWNVSRKNMSPLGEMQAIEALIKIYQAEKPDLVHHFTIKPVLYGSVAAKYAKIPAVVNSVTGLGYVFLTDGWKGSAMRSMIFPLYRYAFSHPQQRVIFENETDQATFHKLGLLKNGASVVIRGVGVNTEYYHPVPEPLLAESVIVFPARMLVDKGLVTLVDAARIIKGKTNARFLLVGDTDPGNPTTVDERMLRGWEQEGLVEWLGFQKDMRSVYQNCNIVTLPSFGEGLPTVLIEAAACGRPIVTTDVAGCRDVVAHGVNGLLVQPNQPEELAQAIEALICEPERRAQMGKAGRQIVLEKFTDAQVNREIFAVYAALLEKV